jgi:hypothetical protein
MYKNNLYVRWCERRRVQGTTSVSAEAQKDEYLEIGNFTVAAVQVKAVSGGASTTQLQFKQAVEPDGPWSSILASPVTVNAYGSTPEVVVTFSQDTSGNPLLRYLSWEVSDGTADFDVTLDISLLLKRH